MVADPHARVNHLAVVIKFIDTGVAVVAVGSQGRPHKFTSCAKTELVDSRIQILRLFVLFLHHFDHARFVVVYVLVLVFLRVDVARVPASHIRHRHKLQQNKAAHYVPVKVVSGSCGV